MGCPTNVELGNNLVFSICTHDPDYGTLTDADAPPAYRVYEEETGTAILTGTMTKLDDANTTGFYTESIACTTANGFEVDKSYHVYIEATVNTHKGGISYGFIVETTLLGAGAVEWSYTVTDADTGGPIDGCSVWVTTDSAGAYVVASGTTNVYGIVTFYIDAGTVYVWRQRAGYNFTNPDQETVS